MVQMQFVSHMHLLGQTSKRALTNANVFDQCGVDLELRKSSLEVGDEQLLYRHVFE